MVYNTFTETLFVQEEVLLVYKNPVKNYIVEHIPSNVLHTEF